MASVAASGRTGSGEPDVVSFAPVSVDGRTAPLAGAARLGVAACPYRVISTSGIVLAVGWPGYRSFARRVICPKWSCADSKTPTITLTLSLTLNPMPIGYVSDK